MVYGECIQLVHTPTEKYLAVSTECSRTEQGNLKVLSEHNYCDVTVEQLYTIIHTHMHVHMYTRIHM